MNGMFFINKEQNMYFSIQAPNFRLKDNSHHNCGKIGKKITEMNVFSL